LPLPRPHPPRLNGGLRIFWKVSVIGKVGPGVTPSVMPPSVFDTALLAKTFRIIGSRPGVCLQGLVRRNCGGGASTERWCMTRSDAGAARTLLRLAPRLGSNATNEAVML
jgi:hypothetical protein